MKNIFLLIAAFLPYSGLAQSFEGVITYSVDYNLESNLAPLKDQIFQKLKTDGEYYDTIRIFIKDNKYLKTDNRKNPVSLIYEPIENKIYSLQKNFEYVTIIDATKFHSFNINIDKPIIEQMDSTKFVNRIPCKLLQLKWDNIGSEIYCYNEQSLKIDPELFKSHKYEYLYEILQRTKSYPIEITKSLNQMMSITMTLVSFEQKEISDELFDIPELKKADKQYVDIIKRTTGNSVMERKN